MAFWKQKKNELPSVPPRTTATSVNLSGQGDAHAGTIDSWSDSPAEGDLLQPESDTVTMVMPAVPLGHSLNEESPEDTARTELFERIRAELHRQVLGKIDLTFVGTMGDQELRVELRIAAENLLARRKDLLNHREREQIINEVMDEAFGLGPLERLFKDDTITDILINGPKAVYVERNGRLTLSKTKFVDDAHLLRIIQRVVSSVGRRVDETSPLVDARLHDGSRLNAVIAPLAVDGSLVSIRRFGSKPLGIQDLLRVGALCPEMVTFLSACVECRANILISGGTGSGKTTLLNVMSSFIPTDERLATIEDAAELQLQQPHVARMETRPANVEGKGEVSTRDLVRNALRMRPDRIVVGECRGSEALDMLQAMNTGHDGSLTTIHANTPRDAIGRLEMMVGMTGFDLPMWTIRRQIASAINIIVQTARLVGGPRRVMKISEITGMEGEVLSMHDIFVFKQTGLDEERRAKGHFMATGIRPHLLERFEASGLSLPVELFEERILK
jgi:pilus assembly protein CpaF